VPRVAYAPGALRDLERQQQFIAEHDAAAALAAAQAITDAVSTLGRHPLIGRPVENGLRELYDYLEVIDTVVILAVRHQREAGFAQDK
jgi:plasmid stabilization system protein ParE